MTDRAQKYLLKFANRVFVLGIWVSISAIFYAVYRINDPYTEHFFIGYTNLILPTFYYKIILFGGISAFCFGLAMRLNHNLKINLSLILVTIGITVYGFETYLEFNYETRTRSEVLDDLNESGITAYPAILPSLFIKSNGLKSADGRIYPFGGISNSTTIFTNESGYYPIIETDEYGFNNPKRFNKLTKLDIVLTGDSFTEGYSVHADETISSVLWKSGFNTLNIGKGGNGSLIRLAALKEYAEPLKPMVVLWLHYINDISELEIEMTSSILRKYLNQDDFSQNLISRQDEIDNLLIDYIQGKMEKMRRGGVRRHWAFKILKLSNIRQRMNLTPSGITRRNLRPKVNLTPPSISTTTIFKDILQKSKQMISGWGGEMYFVFLPAYGQYSTGNNDINREFVLRTTTELKVPMIDIHEEVFASHPDPLSLFPYRREGHYNAEGYRLVAETIRNRLKADGIISKNLEK